MTLYYTTSSPHQWVSLDSKGVQDSGVVDSLAELPAGGQRCVAVVPGEQVTTRTLSMPVRNRQKLLAAIPYAIEDSLITPVDELHFTLLHSGADNQVTFAYVERALMKAWLEQAGQAGIKLVAIVPDYLLLPHATPSSAIISMARNGRVYLRSGLYQGATTDLRNLPAWLAELDDNAELVVDEKQTELFTDTLSEKARVVDIGVSLADWLSHAVPVHEPMLLHGEFEQGSTGSLLKRYWPAVAMIVLAACIKIGSDVGELVWLQKTQAQIEQNMQSLYQEFFPGSRLLSGRARVQTRNKLASLQSATGSSDFTYLLVTTSGLLNRQRVTVEEIDYREGRFVAVLTLDDFAHLDRVSQQLQKEPSITVSLKQSGARGNKVQARFEISRAET